MISTHGYSHLTPRSSLGDLTNYYTHSFTWKISIEHQALSGPRVQSETQIYFLQISDWSHKATNPGSLTTHVQLVIITIIIPDYQHNPGIY